MTNLPDKSPRSELLIYQTEDGKTRIQVRLENETAWLTQSQMGELFQTQSQMSACTFAISFGKVNWRRIQLLRIS